MEQVMTEAADKISAGPSPKGRLVPLLNQVIVRRDPRPTSVGSILLPDRHRPAPYLGTVEAVGPGVMAGCPSCDTYHLKTPRVKVGDRVLIPALGGQELLDWDDGEPLVIIEDDFLHGKVV